MHRNDTFIMFVVRGVHRKSGRSVRVSIHAKSEDAARARAVELGVDVDTVRAENQLEFQAQAAPSSPASADGEGGDSTPRRPRKQQKKAVGESPGARGGRGTDETRRRSKVVWVALGLSVLVAFAAASQWWAGNIVAGISESPNATQGGVALVGTESDVGVAAIRVDDGPDLDAEPYEIPQAVLDAINLICTSHSYNRSRREIEQNGRAIRQAVDTIVGHQHKFIVLSVREAYREHPQAQSRGALTEALRRIGTPDAAAALEDLARTEAQPWHALKALSVWLRLQPSRLVAETLDRIYIESEIGSTLRRDAEHALREAIENNYENIELLESFGVASIARHAAQERVKWHTYYPSLALASMNPGERRSAIEHAMATAEAEQHATEAKTKVNESTMAGYGGVQEVGAKLSEVAISHPDPSTYVMRRPNAAPVRLYSIAFSPDGRSLSAVGGAPPGRTSLSGSAGGLATQVFVWDTSSSTLRLSRGSSLAQHVAYSSRGNRLVVGPTAEMPSGTRGERRRFVAALYEGMESVPKQFAFDPGDGAAIIAMAWGPRDDSILIASTSGVISWPSSLSEVEPPLRATGASSAVGRRRPTESNTPSSVIVLEKECGQALTAPVRWTGPAAISSENGVCVAQSASAIEVWDLNLKEQRGILETRDLKCNRAFEFALSRTGTHLITAFWDGTGQAGTREAYLFDLTTGTRTMRVSGHDDVTCVAICADGDLAASGGPDGVVRIWSTGSRSLVGALAAGSESPYSLAFSANARQLAVATSDGEVRLWDLTRLMGGDAQEPVDRQRQRLAVGPEDVVVQRGAESFSATLVGLSETELVYLRPQGKGRCRAEVADSLVTEVRAGDGAWIAIRRTDGSFASPSVERSKSAGGLSERRSFSDELGYLIYSLEHHYATAIGFGTRPNDMFRQTEFRARMESLAGRATELNNADLAAAYHSIADLSSVAILESKTRHQVLRRLEARQAQAEAARSDAQFNAAVAGLFALGAMALGSTQVATEVVYDDRLKSYVPIATEMLSPEAFQAGASDALQVVALLRQQMASTRAIQQLAASDVQRDLLESLEKAARSQATCAAAIGHVFESTDTGYPHVVMKIDTQIPQHEMPDEAELKRTVVGRCQAATDASGLVHPFVALEARMLLLGDIKNSNDALWAEAASVRDLVQRVPAGPLYSQDRKEILEVAARLGASTLDLNSFAVELSQAAAMRALEMVAWIDSYIKDQGVDSHADLRELALLAKVHLGDAADAVRLATSIERSREASAEFFVAYAVALARLGRRDESVEKLRIALERNWYRNVMRLGKVPEFARDATCKEMLQVKITHRSDVRMWGASQVVLTNRSCFPVTSAIVEIRFATTPGAKSPGLARFEIPVLKPSESFSCDMDSNARALQAERGGGIAGLIVRIMSSDQGPAEVTEHRR